MAEQEDFTKLATEDKLGHKVCGTVDSPLLLFNARLSTSSSPLLSPTQVWRARMMGYEEVTKLFRRIDDENSPEYGKYVGLVKKFPVESNAAAQEKALEATLAFAECASIAGK